jgi:hypothetical protein
VIAYNFMPQVSEDAMVVRTAFNATTRAARGPGFRCADVTGDQRRRGGYSHEQMWTTSNTSRLSGRRGGGSVSPCTRRPAGRRLRAERIMEHGELRPAVDLRQLANAITFCIGCFAEMGAICRRSQPMTHPLRPRPRYPRHAMTLSRHFRTTDRTTCRDLPKTHETG